MLKDRKNGPFKKFGHLRPTRRMMFPVGGGLLGLLVSFGCWYALSVAALLAGLADDHFVALLQTSEAVQSLIASAQAEGVDYHLAALATFISVNPVLIVVAAIAAVFAVTMTAMMLWGQWMFASTGGAFAAVWRALNGHAQSTRTDIRAVLGAGSLLAFLLGVFGVKIWPFLIWDGVLVLGIGAALWCLWRPAQREYFGDEARAELRRAAEAAGPLGMACLVVLGAMAGNSRTAVATMAAPWPTVLAIAAAGVLLGLALPVERHLRNALAIAKHDRTA